MIVRATLTALVIASLAAPLAAQSRGWERNGWGRNGWGAPGPEQSVERWSGHDTSSREGRIEVARFRAEGAGALALGKGTIAVVPAPTGAGDATADVDERELAAYEAAMVDRLAKAGYDVATADPRGGQVAELRILHAVVTPEEAPHKPVSGSMTMGVSNRGSMMGMAVAVDLSKPKKALVSSRLEARIRDRASGAVLWEGRAETVTREGDSHWNDTAIATRLAAALFDGFPTRTDDSAAVR